MRAERWLLLVATSLVLSACAARAPKVVSATPDRVVLERFRSMEPGPVFNVADQHCAKYRKRARWTGGYDFDRVAIPVQELHQDVFECVAG